VHTWGRFSISSDPTIEVILVVYFNSDPALTPLQKRPFQLAKMLKNTLILTSIFRKNFWGIVPRPQAPSPILGYGAAPQNPPRCGHILSGPALANRRPCSNFLPIPLFLPAPLLPFRSVPPPSLSLALSTVNRPP